MSGQPPPTFTSCLRLRRRSMGRGGMRVRVSASPWGRGRGGASCRSSCRWGAYAICLDARVPEGRSMTRPASPSERRSLYPTRSGVGSASLHERGGGEGGTRYRTGATQRNGGGDFTRVSAWSARASSGLSRDSQQRLNPSRQRRACSAHDREPSELGNSKQHGIVAFCVRLSSWRSPPCNPCIGQPRALGHVVPARLAGWYALCAKEKSR